MEQLKNYTIKLLDKNDNMIWSYLMHGYNRQQAVNIFAQLVIGDINTQFDIKEANKVVIEEE